MALNVTIAVIGSGCNTATASPSLAQWDQGQVLKIEGVDLPSAYQVEFSTEYTRNAIPRIGNADGVAIPNELLQRSAPITAYIVLHEGESDRETEYWITIHITPRTPPETVTPDPEQMDVIDETIAALQDGVAAAEAAAESVQNMGVEAETLAPGSPLTVTKEVDPETGAVTLIFGLTQGPKGDDGYSPTITITEIPDGHRFTVTDAIHPSGQSFDVLDGAKGDPGDDGYSPVVTITTITGGHRFTVTDKTHPSGQSFDVLDGAKGDPGDEGYSPVVTITTITGGHRVTITDKTHPSGQSFDVMDGVIQSVNGKSAASITLDAGDIEFDDSETYQSDTVGSELKDLNNALSEIASNTEETVPITAETFLYTAESTLTETYITDGVELAYTATANPTVFYAVNNLEAGHSYKLQYKVESGALSATGNQKMGTVVGATFSSIPTEASFSDGVMTLEFTATATTNALQIAMIYSSKNVTLTTFRIMDTSVPGYIIDNDAVKDLDENNLSAELRAKINNADEIIIDHVPENYFPFTQDAIIVNETPVTVTYSDDNVNLTFTETANPIIIWKIEGLFPGKEYTISFTVSAGSLNTSGCMLRKYLQSAPGSGEVIKSLHFDGDKCVTTFTVPSGETKVSLLIGMVYSSKSVTLSDMTIKDAGAEEYLAIRASAENRNDISASFIYSTQTGDCTILKILGDEKDEVVMVDSSAPVAWNNIKAALDRDAISHVDYFILSHWHGDHMGCIDLLHQNGYIDEDTTFYLPEDPDATSQGLIRDDNPDKIVVQTSQEYLALLTEWGCTKVYPQEDDILEVNDCKFQFWNCDHADYYASSWVDYNECSLCCAMIYGTTVVQFSGDIGPVACQKYYDKSLPCNIFKANHHACGYAVVPLFMSAMCPDLVVTMAGSAIIYSTDPAIQATFATLNNGLQQWCEDEFVPNFVTGVIKANIYMQLDKTGYKFLSNARRCVRSDEGIPVSG